MKLFSAFILSLFIVSCTLNKTKQLEIKYQKLNALENKLVNEDLSINKKKAEILFRNSLSFNQKYTNNKYKELVYVMAAKCSDGLNWNVKNIEIIDLLLKEFPLSQSKPNYLYNKGKIYEEKMNEVEKAKSIYKDIIQNYPNTAIAKNLIHYLEFISKTDKEKFQFLKTNP